MLLAYGHVLTYSEASALQLRSLDEIVAMVGGSLTAARGSTASLTHARGATVGGIANLYRVSITLGAQSPWWFNVAFVIFIPSGVAGTGGAYAALEAEFRPLTLADIAQKLMPNALDGFLASAAARSVHPVQAGFVGRRSMLSSVLRAEGAVEEFLYDLRQWVGVFFFDISLLLS